MRGFLSSSVYLPTSTPNGIQNIDTSLGNSLSSQSTLGYLSTIVAVAELAFISLSIFDKLFYTISINTYHYKIICNSKHFKIFRSIFEHPLLVSLVLCCLKLMLMSNLVIFKAFKHKYNYLDRKYRVIHNLFLTL